MDIIKPKVGEVWKKSFKDGTDKDDKGTHCFVIEEDGKLLGIWFSVPWELAQMDDVEDGKDGWKRVYEPKHITGN